MRHKILLILLVVVPFHCHAFTHDEVLEARKCIKTDELKKKHHTEYDSLAILAELGSLADTSFKSKDFWPNILSNLFIKEYSFDSFLEIQKKYSANEFIVKLSTAILQGRGFRIVNVALSDDDQSLYKRSLLSTFSLVHPSSGKFKVEHLNCRPGTDTNMLNDHVTEINRLLKQSHSNFRPPVVPDIRVNETTGWFPAGKDLLDLRDDNLAFKQPTSGKACDLYSTLHGMLKSETLGQQFAKRIFKNNDGDYLIKSGDNLTENNIFTKANIDKYNSSLHPSKLDVVRAIGGFSLEGSDQHTLGFSLFCNPSFDGLDITFWNSMVEFLPKGELKLGDRVFTGEFIIKTSEYLYNIKTYPHARVIYWDFTKQKWMIYDNQDREPYSVEDKKDWVTPLYPVNLPFIIGHFAEKIILNFV